MPGSARWIASITSLGVAVTFDDGPDADLTPYVLDTLDRLAMKATFFVLSDRAEAHPDIIRETVARGHELGLHADRHEALDRLAIPRLTARLVAARRSVEAISGARVRWHRPPFGRLSWRGLQAARRAGMDVAMWSHDPGDWRPLALPELSANVAASLVPGAIVLLHDGEAANRTTADALAAAVGERGSPPAVRLSDVA